MPKHSLLLPHISILREYGEPIKSSTLGSENKIIGYTYQSFEVYCGTCKSEFFAHRNEGFSTTAGVDSDYNFMCPHCSQQDSVKSSELKKHFGK